MIYTVTFKNDDGVKATVVCRWTDVAALPKPRRIHAKWCEPCGACDFCLHKTKRKPVQP